MFWMIPFWRANFDMTWLFVKTCPESLIKNPEPFEFMSGLSIMTTEPWQDATEFGIDFAAADVMVRKRHRIQELCLWMKTPLPLGAGAIPVTQHPQTASSNPPVVNWPTAYLAALTLYWHPGVHPG